MSTHPFIRQSENKRNHVTLRVPKESTILEHLRSLIPDDNDSFNFRFHTVPYDEIVQSLHESNAEVSDGIYNFNLREGVLSFFKILDFPANEFAWSYASSYVIDVLAAVRVGETLDVQFDTPFSQIHNILRYHFPSGVPDSGYGQYSIHLTQDVNNTGFRIVSSFEEKQIIRTHSRLPFFFGFRIFGNKTGETEDPVWRSLFGLAIKYCTEENWHLSVLHSAFALENVIDLLLRNHILNEIPEKYVEHLLRVGEKKSELEAINEIVLKTQFSKSQMGKLYNELNELVFTKRNRIAHGQIPSSNLTRDDATSAIHKVATFIWDFAIELRKYLLITNSPLSFEGLIDEQLIQSCKSELEQKN